MHVQFIFLMYIDQYYDPFFFLSPGCRKQTPFLFIIFMCDHMVNSGITAQIVIISKHTFKTYVKGFVQAHFYDHSFTYSTSIIRVPVTCQALGRVYNRKKKNVVLDLVVFMF